MPAFNLAPHEALELHEFLRNEITCAQKLKGSVATIQDSELKTFVQRSYQMKRDTINEFQQLLSGMQLQ